MLLVLQTQVPMYSLLVHIKGIHSACGSAYHFVHSACGSAYHFVHSVHTLEMEYLITTYNGPSQLLEHHPGVVAQCLKHRDTAQPSPLPKWPLRHSHHYPVCVDRCACVLHNQSMSSTCACSVWCAECPRVMAAGH